MPRENHISAKKSRPFRDYFREPLYAYAYPEPAGCKDAAVRPKEAFYSSEMSEFILPYDVVRRADQPEEVLLDFLQSTYEAAANLGKWDRNSLERRK